jgi:hypothetical protein
MELAGLNDYHRPPESRPRALRHLREMPTGFRRGALPFLFRQRACLGFSKIWIDDGVIWVLCVHGIELFPDAQESLAVDVYGNRIGAELASGPASDFAESLRLLENRMRNGDCGFFGPCGTCCHRAEAEVPALR